MVRRPGIEPGPPAWKAGILTTELTTRLYKIMRPRGIEPGSPRPQRGVLPLNQRRLLCVNVQVTYKLCSCGPMAKACDYESRDWGFESLQECFFASLQDYGACLGVDYTASFTSYAHTMVKPPDPIRTPKLSTIGPAQYCGGGPRGNRR